MSISTELIDGWSPNFVAFLGALLSNFLILIWLALLGATKAKNRKNLW
jgi:hypothetical protein